MLALGWQVDIVTASFFHKYFAPPKTARLIDRQVIDGLQYHWLRTPAYRSRGIGQVVNQIVYTLLAFGSTQRFAEPRPIAVIASSPHPFVVFPAARLARETGARLVYEVRDLWPQAIIELGGFSRSNLYIRALTHAERYGATRSDAIVSVKPGDWEYFSEQYKVPREKIRYIANGFLQSEASHDRNRVETRHRGGSDIFTVGYIGALSAYYCIDTLLQAAARLPRDERFRFVIVGDGSDRTRLEAVARQMGLWNVDFVGAIPKNDVESKIRTFDLCYVGLKDVGVNQYGISTNKLFEYMAAGKPTIACYRTRYDPISLSGGGATVPPGDADGLANAIARFAGSPELCNEAGVRARQYFEREHEFSRLARKYSDLLQELNGDADLLGDFRPI